MARSLRFGSAPRYYGRPIQTRFRYGSGPKALNLATEKQLAGSLCKRHAVARNANKLALTSLQLLVDTWFQVLFHSLC